MAWYHALLLGIVEGLTEFLPISSTGHLMLTEELLGLDLQTEFLSSFSIAIQLGAILSVVVLYGRTLLVDRAVNLRVLAALAPTLVLGALLYAVVKQILLKSPTVVIISLIVGGLVIILFERHHGEKPDAVHGLGDISPARAFWIGVFQALAMIPGVSRSAATVLGAMALGVSRKTAVEFSFLLAVPTMAAATAKDLYESSSSFAPHEFQLLALGFVVSFVVALLSIVFLLRFVQSHTFAPFGVYRILAGILFALLLWGPLAV